MSKLSIFFITMLCGIQAAAANLVLVKSDGTQLHDKQGNVLAEELLDNVRKITFAEPDTPSAVENALQEGYIAVYPNPTHERLIVQGFYGQTLRVFDMQGRLMTTAEGNEVNVCELGNGTYLLQVGTQAVQFVKK